MIVSNPSSVHLLPDRDDAVADMIRQDRLASEFCGGCHTRHHPDDDCQEGE